MKTLIIQSAYIGDLILTEPLLRRVRDKFGPPTLLVRNSCSPLTSFMGETFYTMELKKNGWTLISTMKVIDKVRDSDFELVLSPHNSFRSAFIARNAYSAVKVGFENSGGFWFYDILVPYRKEFHQVKRNLGLLEAMTGEDYSITPPELYLEEGHRKRGEDVIRKAGLKRPFIAIFPGSRWKTKRWLERGFVELAKMLEKDHRNPVIIGSEKEKKLVSRVGKEAGVQFIHNLDLYDLVCFLSHSEMVIANDSGPTHIANALKKPVVVIFGPTTPSLGFYPLNRDSRIVEAEGIECRPCGMHGSDRCPEKHFLCMKSITAEQVMSAIKEIL